MKREAVADRIVTYSDALVAFALVNGVAFLVALGEPELRCSIAGIAGFIGSVNVILSVVVSLLLLWLKRYEDRLRVGEDPDELVSRFWAVIGSTRLVLVWSFTCVVLLGVWASTQDANCQVTLRSMQ